MADAQLIRAEHSCTGSFANIVANSHFKSLNRLYPMIHKQYPDMTKAEVMEEIKKKFHDRRLKMTQKRPYMVRIFDPVIGCYPRRVIVRTESITLGGQIQGERGVSHVTMRRLHPLPPDFSRELL